MEFFHSLYVVGIYLSAFFVTTFGLHIQEQNTTANRDHEAVLELQRSLQNVSVELSSLRAEMYTIRAANQKLMKEVGSYNHNLEILKQQTRSLTLSLLDVSATTELMNATLSHMQDRGGESPR